MILHEIKEQASLCYKIVPAQVGRGQLKLLL